MTHELKTPLTSVQGFAQAILDRTAKTPEAHTGAVEEGDLEAETARRMSGTVAELYEILMAGEPKWPEAEA